MLPPMGRLYLRIKAPAGGLTQPSEKRSRKSGASKERRCLKMAKVSQKRQRFFAFHKGNKRRQRLNLLHFGAERKSALYPVWGRTGPRLISSRMKNGLHKLDKMGSVPLSCKIYNKKLQFKKIFRFVSRKNEICIE